MKTKAETKKAKRLFEKHCDLVGRGNTAKTPECRREYYKLAQEVYRSYQEAGGKR